MKRNRGFIKAVVLILVALIILKFTFGITLQTILDAQFFKTIVYIIKTFLGMLWDAVLITLDFIKELVVTAKNFVAGLNKSN